VFYQDGMDRMDWGSGGIGRFLLALSYISILFMCFFPSRTHSQIVLLNVQCQNGEGEDALFRERYG
jgi:hypothetical protein